MIVTWILEKKKYTIYFKSIKLEIDYLICLLIKLLVSVTFFTTLSLNKWGGRSIADPLLNISPGES